MNPLDNDHVTVHAIDGFRADDLFGALAEAGAMSQATKCDKYLFFLSLNPPHDAKVPVSDFESAIAQVEDRLGLNGKPRAIVFHEENGRRDAHAVWSRINGQELKAIDLPFYKRKLNGLSHELYIHHDWEVPEGFRDAAKRNPLNYWRQEAGQAKRAKRDPKAIKAMFRGCWEASDSGSGFEAALQEQGFVLARGDRRGFVAVDADGKIWSLYRRCGVKPEEMRTRLGSEMDLPSVEDVSHRLGDLPKKPVDPRSAVFEARRAKLVEAQSIEQADLLGRQEWQRIAEIKSRQKHMPNGLRGLLARATGQHKAMLVQFAEQTHAPRIWWVAKPRTTERPQA